MVMFVKLFLFSILNYFPCVITVLLSYQRPHGLDYLQLPHQRKTSGKFGILVDACCILSHSLLNSEICSPFRCDKFCFCSHSPVSFFSSMLYISILQENSKNRIHLNTYFLSHLNLSEKWTSLFFFFNFRFWLEFSNHTLSSFTTFRSSLSTITKIK